MKRFLIGAFVVAFIAGYILAGPGEYRGALAIGSALFFTGIAWIVARLSDPRWGALAMGLTITAALIGR